MTNSLIHPAEGITIRNFEQADMTLLGGLYDSVTSKENAVFWWVGDEDNWANVYCAFENGKMVAKGQVEIMNIVPPGRSEESRHSIYLNLKTITEREQDYDLLDSLYQTVLLRALDLKETLSKEYKTTLCVGNNSSEIANTQFFEKEKGFCHYNSLFRMNHNLNDTFSAPELSKEFDFATWMMETPQEEDHYLELEAEVWPETPLGKERLSEFKQNPRWSSMVVREEERIVGSLMVWQEEKSGYIENVFVLEPWRRSGIAKYMLSKALNYFRTHGLEEAYLMVLTNNDSALRLYESVGFNLTSEERRYRIEI
ncbi:GNAT family N-acetyltransferase [Paenibacillus sp.]|uniref:GNAT family N-acetyltransferase n=1 Tax=Paenibacillus sp. TaxID=58172 RepID=UPI0028AE2ED0|nr:GNAT family N-acetyltransferase [Paenibacillus sp.]